VHWHNTKRLHGYLGDIPPAEFEKAFYAGQTDRTQLVGIKLRESPSDPVRFTSWEDVDLEAQTVHVRGTKTRQADRTLGMSPDLTARLRARAELHGTTGLVFGTTYFASKLGQPRDRNNVGKVFRSVFDSAGVQWAGTHTFRRTVASWVKSLDVV